MKRQRRKASCSLGRFPEDKSAPGFDPSKALPWRTDTGQSPSPTQSGIRFCVSGVPTSNHSLPCTDRRPGHGSAPLQPHARQAGASQALLRAALPHAAPAWASHLPSSSSSSEHQQSRLLAAPLLQTPFCFSFLSHSFFLGEGNKSQLGAPRGDTERRELSAERGMSLVCFWSHPNPSSTSGRGQSPATRLSPGLFPQYPWARVL